jgi:hypothetical protein
LHRSDDGKLHVIYHEPAPRDPFTGLYYLEAEGDPGIRAHWSEPVPVTADLHTYAYMPVFVADADTVWVGYTSGDAGAGDTRTTDVDRGSRAWFRKGYPIGTSTSKNRTWEGLVWLASDYVVREDHTLTVLPGTL